MTQADILPSRKLQLIDRIQSVGALYIADFAYLPSDKVSLSPMGKARSPLEFTIECAGFNFAVATMIEGGDSAGPDSEVRKALIRSIDSGEKALAALRQSIDALKAVLSPLDESDLTRHVTMPWGQPSTIYEAASMTSGHMMYHCGQVNYIQALYGDDENHWA